MANIPVEKTGTNWLPWILGLLALALIGFFIFLAADDPDNDDDAVVVDDTEVVTPVMADDLDMDDLYVTRVVGDKTFFVAPTAAGADETLVYLEEEPDPTDNVEGRYDVTAGQHIAITGSMEDTPADVTPWGLTAEQADMVGPQYIRATSLTILDEAGMDDGEMAAEGGGLTMLEGDLSAMAGQALALDGVRVTDLVGDSTFAVGTGDTRTVVVLESLGEEEDGPGDGTDGRFDVNMGDVVDLDGTVMAFRRGMRGTSDMTASELDLAEARRYVIVINSPDGFSKR